ncbi:Sulfate permease 1 [Candida viswanathii]|uniref:Sulfate permease 1 n=1 Tax=Candida viswanathii TaxID=5486 RepID=A0A367Y198_9ASCO|nr:Sulfate permease 1 [Candida viswanathii]
MSHLLEKVKSITSEDPLPVENIELPHLYGDEQHYHPSHDFRGDQFSSSGSNNYNNVYVPAYDEHEAKVLPFLQNIFAHPLIQIRDYLLSLFPILKWILHYNLRWAYSDLVAGVTVGVVLVPQSMSYAQLAGLEPQYGLYSSFVGVFIYSFFATSKDVSIGPVAVMSLQVSKVIAHVQNSFGDQYAAPEIATFLSLICGGIAAGIGLLRLGFILEFISIPAVMGFMTGSAFSIISGQVPALMGYNSKVNTRDSTYLVVVNTLKHLPDTTIDATFGLIPLLILYFWKWFTEFVWFFYVQQLRNAIVIIVATAICWEVAFTGDDSDFKSPIKTIGEVPRGLRNVGPMTIPDGIIGAMASEIPVSTVILLLEHIAISKSFGRINDYKIVPDQEVIAIGVTNLIGTFFNAYPATGSFSRSALKAKCGVKTPLAGIFTGAVVLLALYALTSAFYYIPKATLSAVIIHAVSDLIASYKVTWSFYKMSPIDCGIFLIAVILTVFVTIEVGIYFAIAASVVVLLVRVAFPQGFFMGKIKVAEVINPVIEHVGDSDESDTTASEIASAESSGELEIHQVLSKNEKTDAIKDKSSKLNVKKVTKPSDTTTGVLARSNPEIKFHTRWVPLTKENINAGINVLPPPPGVIVFKPVESFTYPNASDQVDKVSDEAKRLTKRAKPYNSSSAGSRPWNDPEIVEVEDTRPVLRIVHFDFSTVASIDVTALQALVDLRKALNAYADREVEFHFSGINSPWIRRGLLNAGFGTYEDGLLSSNNYVDIATGYADLENGVDEPYFAATGTNTPFFHLDIPDYY